MNHFLKKYSILILFFCIINYHGNAQSVGFGHYLLVKSANNPAFIGSEKTPSIWTNYQIQYPSLDYANKSMTLGLDLPLSSGNTSLGIKLGRDMQGGSTIIANYIALGYNHALLYQQGELRLGFDIGYKNLKLNTASLIFEDQIISGNLTQEPINQTYDKNQLDINIGLAWISDQYILGLSISHLNRNIDQFISVSNYPGYNQYLLYNLVFGSKIYLHDSNNRDDEAFLLPSVNYVQSGKRRFCSIGVNYHKQKIFGGLHYKHSFANQNSLGFVAGFKLGRGNIGYRFDYSLSKLGFSGTAGTHELGIKYYLRTDESEDYHNGNRNFDF